MPDASHSKDVLCDILRVLERIEVKLDSHDERFRQLEHGSPPSKYRSEKEEDDETSGTLVASLVSSNVDFLAKDETNGVEKVKHAPRIPYGDWTIDRFIRSMPEDQYEQWDTSHLHLERFYRMADLASDVRRRIGACWDMPDDTRFPLKFLKSNILKTYVTGSGPNIDTFSKAKQKIEREMSQLCDFDDALRKHSGNDFVVVDFDPMNNSRMYRLGQQATGPELMVDSAGVESAPWSRLILYQGATTGDSIDPERRRPEIPYFSRTDMIIGVFDHISNHLLLRSRPTTVNPYLSHWTGFHTTFYEIVESTEMKQKELWKHGPLYDHPLGWNFRKCAFTLYAPATSDINHGSSEVLHSPTLVPARHWTLLVLAPCGFFNEHSVLFPSQTAEHGYNAAQVIEDQLGKLTLPGAEMKFIGQGLEKISERWAGFQAYFDYMLDSGNSLMHPSDHDNLLFDDGSFSRSRKYFWAIDCLSEFEASITDNLAQWEQYRAARIDPIAHSLPQMDRRLLVGVERQYRILQNQRETFRQKVVTIKALRDALFNASAVIESRASTRLGENVKLLTFVSIFFLPLSFTTSLWSINDSFSQTILIYVIIVVALITYVTMFNINSLAHGFGNVYNIKKRRIVRAMKHDQRSQKWRERGRRFEVFRPKHENPEPSEWFVPLYVAMHPGILLGRGGRRDEGVTYVNSSSPSSGAGGSKGGLLRWLRLKAPSASSKEIGRTDEGWVM